MKRYSLALTVFSGLLLSTVACTNEFLNPSTASQPQVIGSSDGLITVANGLQFRYTTNGASSVPYTSAAISGLTTREMFLINVGNIDEANLAVGAGNVQGTNATVRNLWTQCQLVRSNADLLLADPSAAADAGTRSGVIGYASIFRALSLGTLGQYFVSAPARSAVNAQFVERQQLFREAVAGLEIAATQLAAAPVSANFNGKVVPGINITNTIQALIARYSLFAGDYDKAIAAAARVDLASRSVFTFDNTTRNPLFETTFQNLNVIQPNVNLGLTGALAPEGGDRRVAFYTRPSSNTLVSPVVGSGFYTANDAAIPVYLPGEMMLIQAEAFARKGDLTNAITQLNRVRTKTAAQDAFGVGAGLGNYNGPQTAAAVLQEIYRNRCLELAFMGFRLEDSRRFERPGPGVTGSERVRNFMPYPRTERDNNTNTPPDPTI